MPIYLLGSTSETLSETLDLLSFVQEADLTNKYIESNKEEDVDLIKNISKSKTQKFLLVLKKLQQSIRLVINLTTQVYLKNFTC